MSNALYPPSLSSPTNIAGVSAKSFSLFWMMSIAKLSIMHEIDILLYLAFLLVIIFPNLSRDFDVIPRILEVGFGSGRDLQFLKDNDAVFRDRVQLEANPRLNPPGNPALVDAVEQSLFSNHRVNTVLVQLMPGANPKRVADDIQRWLRLTAYPRDEMEEILIGQLIATASKQIGLFLVILTIVSAAIVALTIYSMTQTKLKEIAVLKLIGTRNGLISRMILLEAIGLGLIGFLTGKLAVTYWAPLFPKHIVLLPDDTLRALLITMVICILASFAGSRAALRVPPGSAIGG